MKKVLLIYLIGCAVLYKTKPDIMFSKKGEFKHFGVGPYKTITPYWLVSLIIGLIGYLYITIQSNSFIEN